VSVEPELRQQPLKNALAAVDDSLLIDECLQRGFEYSPNSGRRKHGVRQEFYRIQTLIRAKTKGKKPMGIF
jgi:hypothetical protein